MDLPSSPVDNLPGHMNLRPLARGTRAWVNTGLRVLGIDTTRGELLWDSGEPAGWEQLSSYSRGQLVRGVGLLDLVSAVAVSGDTLVAPLQLAATRSENAHIDGLTITVALPERRLFAFDAETGEAIDPRELYAGPRPAFPEEEGVRRERFVEYYASKEA
mgnify:CR=1 FL=1